ncbi:MAG: hypothetical protein ACJA0I_000799 [Gammaproteobacteria bacterium]
MKYYPKWYSIDNYSRLSTELWVLSVIFALLQFNEEIKLHVLTYNVQRIIEIVTPYSIGGYLQ